VISKFDMIAELKGKRVLDIGGAGYNETGRRRILLQNALKGVHRTLLDLVSLADLIVDLNQRPLPAFWCVHSIAWPPFSRTSCLWVTH
jgi:hypothetical protein